MIKVKYKNEEINIFEYKEAERLIRRLSNEHAGDVTSVSRGGRGRNKVEYYNFPCAFDIETTSIRPGELDYNADDDAPPLAFPYLFQWNIFGNVIMVRTYKQAMAVFSWCAKYFRLAINRRLVFFVHNLNFEYFFWKDLWKIEPKYSFALDDKHPVTIVCRDGLMFRDSYKLTNMSLESLSKDWAVRYQKDKELIDYSELRTPYSVLSHDVLLYSALDVLSLSESVENYLAARGEGLWTSCPTSTSFIRKRLKTTIGFIHTKYKNPEQKKYSRYLKRQKIDAPLFELLARAARGGNTHTNRKYTGQLLHGILHADICSSYPTQMICYPEFPLGVWRPLDAGAYVEDIEFFERNGYCTVFDVVLVNARLKPEVSVPYISISKMIILSGEEMIATDNGRYMGGLQQIQISIFGIEWDIIKNQYDFDDAIITNGYFTNKGYLPDIVRRFILDLYERKTKLKNVENKEEEYNIAKSELNGVYGMALTSPFRLQYELAENGIIEKPPENKAEFLEKYQNSRSYFLPYAAGVVVATLGRVMLQKYIDAVGFDNFLYCDTDSIFAVNAKESEKRIRQVEKELIEYHRKCGFELVYNDVKGKPHELGVMECDELDAFKSFGAKKYITVLNGKLTCTIAGVPKKKGAEVIGTPENFRLGLNFPGSITGKLCLWYNEAPGFDLHDEKGRQIEIHSNVAMMPVDYLLSMSRDYMDCLSIEGNFHWKFSEALNE